MHCGVAVKTARFIISCYGSGSRRRVSLVSGGDSFSDVACVV